MPEKVLLVIADKRTTKKFELQETVQEMQRLINSSGGQVQEVLFGLVEKPTPAYYIGSGKAQELGEKARALKSDVVILSRDLSPTQVRNLEEACGIRVVDRTGLILDIFACRAKTREGKLQVELAQLIYTLPRLSDMREELSRLGGGIGTRGPGEQKIEIDRRRIRTKISKIKEDLEKIRAHRTRVRTQRRRQDSFVVSLVGYTNAGKSTLLNQMTGADVLAVDKLFATLDPTTRRLQLGGGKTVLLTDTVGFLKDLPHTLIEAFKATLEEINDSDLVLEVADITDPNLVTKMAAVEQVLADIEAQQLDRLLVFNKVDLLESPAVVDRLRRQYPEALFLSAKTGLAKEVLVAAIESRLLQKQIRPQA